MTQIPGLRIADCVNRGTRLSRDPQSARCAT